MHNIMEFPWQQEKIILHSQCLIRSFQHWIGKQLLDVNGSPIEIAQALFYAPFVLVSHGTEADPIFNYGNHQALALWELSWDDFTKMPSRRTAEEIVQQERDRLLAAATTQGFSYFSGVRLTSTGKRFHIQDGILWNLIDEQNQYCGQAAVYSQCTFIT
ncbi:MEKHLA domain-containing protein [Nostoc sp. CENA543]|nr:MEKHLA domain-containing protein [Nostoc sp. CENA543]AUT04172.1 MEKHLA domain-containing protein [Nostoc sp. CENA543]